MKLRAYSSYREIRTAWTDRIPSHWNIKRVKFLADIRYGLGEPPERVDDGGIAFIRATDINRGRINPEKIQYVDPNDVPWQRNPTLRMGDILVVRSGAYTGDSAIVPPEFDGAIAGYDMVISPNDDIFPGFLAYAMVSKCVLDGQIYLAKTRAAQPHLNAEELGNIEVVIPPQHEQVQIVSFLDRSITYIDALVSKRQAHLRLLEERRQALLTQTVCQGIDFSVPMRHSGPVWFPKIPLHWTLKRLRFVISRIEQGWSPQCENYPADDGQWGVLKVGAVNGVEFRPNENKVLPDDLEPREWFEIKEGDVLMSRANTRQLLGSAAIVSKVQPRLLLCDKLYRLMIDETVDREFLVLALRSSISRFQFEREATGASGSMQNIGQDTVKNLVLAFPPLSEQRAIVQWLRSETSVIDQCIDTVQRSIALLQENRAALITAAVTGQIDVRGVAAAEAA